MLNQAVPRNLRPQPRSGPPGISDLPAATLGPISGSEIHCPGCHSVSAATRKFCGNCGRSLWEPCHQCGTLSMAGEKFCGACGADLVGGMERRIRDCREKLQEAERMQAEHRYDEALALLGPISRNGHPGLEELAQLAAATIQRLTQERARRVAEAEAAVDSARDRLAASDYEGAIHVLEQISLPFRTGEAADLLNEATRSAQEVATLSEELRQAVQQKRTDELPARLGRLLSIKPDHAQAQRLAERFRRRLCEAARDRLAQHRYDAALECLEQIPQPARDAEVEELREQAAELASLWWSLQNAPVVDKVLLSMGHRLIKTSPGDPRSQKLLAELQRRAALPRSDARRTGVPWAAAPEQTHVGYPVDWVTGFQRIRYAEGFDPSLLVEHPGCFFVAAGLALQGLGLAEVNTNLLPQDRSVLGRMGRLMRTRSARAAWGIDLSSSGLKAVRLAIDPRDGQVAIEACDHIEHRKLLSQAVNEEDERGLIEETVRAFLGRNDCKGDRTCLGLPGRMAFSRQINLPIMDPAKLPAAVQYEAKRCIPFSLDDLVWDYEVLDPRDGETPPRSEQQIALIAVKRIQIRERLAQLQRAGLKTDIVQCDHLAIQNFIAYDFLGSGGTAERPPLPPGAAMAILDLGSDATNIVLTGPGLIGWYSSGFGGHDFTKALVQAFQLTVAQAEELKRNPGSAPSLNRVQKAIEPVFEELATDVQRAVASLGKNTPNRKIERILGLGGGFRTHGLLRYLRLGR